MSPVELVHGSVGSLVAQDLVKQVRRRFEEKGGDPQPSLRRSAQAQRGSQTRADLDREPAL